MLIKTLRLYYHTLRYLKPSQFYWRLRRLLYQPKISLKVPLLKIRKLIHAWRPGIAPDHLFFDAHDNIIFLHEPLALSTHVWQASQNKSRLWRYHLHYFESLLSQHDEERKQTKKLLTDWIQHCPPDTKDAWDPYPTSKRLVHCIQFELQYGGLNTSILENMYIQARYLARIPEYHLLGNHLFENAKALIFAGLFFEGPEPDQWLQLGQDILTQEIPEQILNDGGHFELSPMYHAIILEGLLDLYNLYQTFGLKMPERWTQKIPAMRTWLHVMTHPDGGISFFNDSALNMAATPAQLEAYALRLNLSLLAPLETSLTVLPESGYIRLHHASAVVLIDCARIGPDYLPGHAHADTLSFELSLFGQRTIVNSGTSTYQDPTLRTFQRSTAAHNTVELNASNSSEVWGAFRVARRAYPAHIQYRTEGDALIVEASHTGYQHTYDCTHRRTFRLTHTQLEIQDQLIFSQANHAPVTAIARFFIHPDILVKHDGSERFVLPRAIITTNAITHIRQAQYYPEFGLNQENQVIECHFEKACKTVVSWAL